MPLLAQAGAKLDRIKAEGRIVLAHRESSVPFSYLDAGGKPVGYAVDLSRKLAEAVRAKLGPASLNVAMLQASPATASRSSPKARLICSAAEPPTMPNAARVWLSPCRTT